MDAKDVLKKWIDYEPDESSKDYPVHEAILNAMEEYAKQKCEEQRILCEEYATVHDFMPNDPIEDKIRNAPLATDK